DDDIALVQVNQLAVVELEIAFTRQQDRIIDGFGAVHEFGRARREFGDPDDTPLAGADVIVAYDETFLLCRSGRLGIVDRHLVGRPYLAARDVGAGRGADPIHALVARDDRLAIGIVPRNDPPYLKCHYFPPTLSLVIPAKAGIHGGKR